MKRHLLFTSSLALATAFAGQSMADVTAADIWANQQAYLGSIGLRPNGTLSGNVLSNTEVNAVFPMGVGSFQIKGPDISMVDNADGTVTITYPSPSDITLSGFIQDAGQFEAALRMTHDGYTIVASGDAGDITYTSDVRNMRIELREVSFPDSEDFDIAGVMTLDQWNATNHVTEGNLITVENETEMGSSSAQIIISDPSGMITTTDQTTAPMRSSMTGAFPVGGSDLLNLSEAFRNGLSVSFESASEGSQSQTIVMQGGELFSNQTTSYGPQTASGSLNESGLVINAEASDIQATIEQQMVLPVPIELAIDAISAQYDIPVNASEETQDFRFALDMSGITLVDDVWGMFDPAGQLPRDPADIALDVSGEGTTGIDILDIMGWATLQAAPPIEVDNVTLSNLRIAAVGAEATAEGAMTFDWTDFTTIPGIARPEGEVEINVSGANALMDTLTAMGLLTDEDTMGARMMMGIFAEPTGDDALRSVLEINDQGHILANGQRIR